MRLIQEAFLVHPRAAFRFDVPVQALRGGTTQRIDQWDGFIQARVLLVDHVPGEVSGWQQHTVPLLELLVNALSPEPCGQRLSRMKGMLSGLLQRLACCLFLQCMQKTLTGETWTLSGTACLHTGSCPDQTSRKATEQGQRR